MPPFHSVPIVRHSGGGATGERDLLAVEQPVEIRLRAAGAGSSRPVAITMRTPGDDAELAAGFLFAEGIIRSADDIVSIDCGHEGRGKRCATNRVVVELRSLPANDLARLDRHSFVSSSCGVCGKRSIDALASVVTVPLPEPEPLISPAVVSRLPETLRGLQSVFEATGGLHAAALFDFDGRLLALREDVGRHNALDKLIGAEFLHGRLPLHDRIVLLSGRASFELVQKAVVAGISCLAAIGAPSSLAVELASAFRLTLAGFLRDDRFNVYSAPGRIATAARPLGAIDTPFIQEAT